VIDSGRLTSPDSEPLKNVTLRQMYCFYGMVNNRAKNRPNEESAILPPPVCQLMISCTWMNWSTVGPMTGKRLQIELLSHTAKNTQEQKVQIFSVHNLLNIVNVLVILLQFDSG
jgi:hypothetical protein